MTLPSVTAIVVSYETGPRLKDCLYALWADAEVDHIVVIDNGNPPAMQAWLDRFSAREATVSVIRPGDNLGFGRAVNLGAAAVKGGDLLVINPDAVLRQKSVSGMQEVAMAARKPCIVGGRIFDHRGQEQRGTRRRELTLWRAITNALGWNTWTLERSPAPQKPVAMPVITGAFFLISKASFDQLGGFDERYFLHVEDVDLCRRCRIAGGEVIYDPRAGAMHDGATSASPSLTVARHKADSLALYLRTYAKGPIEKLFTATALPVMRALMLLKAR